MAESEEELKSLLIKVKEENEKVGLKLWSKSAFTVHTDCQRIRAKGFLPSTRVLPDTCPAINFPTHSKNQSISFLSFLFSKILESSFRGMKKKKEQGKKENQDKEVYDNFRNENGPQTVLNTTESFSKDNWAEGQKVTDAFKRELLVSTWQGPSQVG